MKLFMIYILGFHGSYVSSKEGDAIPQKLQTAYSLFKAYCTSKHETPMVKHFSRDNLGWESMAKYPEASFKGSDTRLLLGWLIDWMTHFQVNSVNSICADALEACRSMDGFMRLVFTSDRTFLDREQGFLCLKLLNVWQMKTMACAKQCFRESLCFFNLPPKFHYIFHVTSDLKKQLGAGGNFILNPALFSTQMAEEYIGKSCRIARTVHPSTAVQRTAQKWLVYMKQWLEGQ